MTDRPTIRLYDTMRREKVEFAPLDPNCVRMYVCGPTVYDHAHIGNARPIIVFDVLFRLLRHVYGEDNVVYVRNITDVDDKINARAARDFPDLPLNEAIERVTGPVTKQFHEDVAALGCLPPTHEPRATDNIPQMIALIESLIARGHAYEVREEGEVLFDVTSMPDYGALSNRRLDEQRAGARVEAASHKRHPGDFVLWKRSTEEEPGWDSPFGRGRPGWHLECSAMSDRLLWDEVKDQLGADALASPHRFDIHGGGIDLTFPHHENEIAQTRCAHGTDAMASVWMHNGYLQLEGRKMSKSEGNFVTIHDLLHTEKFGGRRWPGEVLRLAMLMTHYREPIDFSVKRLEEASKRRERWLRKIGELPANSIKPNLTSKLTDSVGDDLSLDNLLRQFDRLGETSDERIATANGLVWLGIIQDPAEIKRSARISAQVTRYYFKYADESVMLSDIVNVQDSKVTASFVNGNIEKRIECLANRNFAEADRIRDELAAEGIQLMDYKDPDTGERRTKWEVKR